MGGMTKQNATQWLERWRTVEDRIGNELARESAEERFEALAMMMASTDLFDMRLLDEEDAAARERWAQLRVLAARRR